LSSVSLNVGFIKDETDTQYLIQFTKAGLKKRGWSNASMWIDKCKVKETKSKNTNPRGISWYFFYIPNGLTGVSYTTSGKHQTDGLISLSACTLRELFPNQKYAAKGVSDSKFEGVGHNVRNNTRNKYLRERYALNGTKGEAGRPSRYRTDLPTEQHLIDDLNASTYKYKDYKLTYKDGEHKFIPNQKFDMMKAIDDGKFKAVLMPKKKDPNSRVTDFNRSEYQEEVERDFAKIKDQQPIDYDDIPF
jgi:hypothetical protein